MTLSYLTPTSDYWACDIESNGLLEGDQIVDRIWCVCVENIITGERHAFTDKDSFGKWLDRGHVLVGHNFLAYDLVVLNRLWGLGIGVSRVVDTFVLSMLYNPTFSGGHSLGAWGERLRFPKTDHNQWDRFSDEMLSYCENDTALTRRLYNRLSSRMRGVGFSDFGCEIEHLSWNIIQNKQRRNGFPFDKKKAEELYVELRQREGQLRDEIYKLWPPSLECVKVFKMARKANSEPTKGYLGHAQQYPKLVIHDDGTYSAYDWVSFNLGSPKQRIEKLLELGWQPTQWTVDKRTKEKKNPKIDEDSLLAFAAVSGRPEVSAIAKWLVVNSRANMVRTWLDAYNEKTSAIHGKLFIASTLRYRHSNPNSANVPAVRSDKEKGILYGEEGTFAYECRDLFTCGDPERYRLVGVDAKGIQIRVLLNYAYSQDALDLYLHGDPHVRNAEILGLANKPAAKKFFYTLVMGGGGERLAADQAQFGTTLTARQGAAMKQQMIDSVPGFDDLIKRLQDELSRTGRIKLCDGTPVLVPSPHMVIPYLLQGDESRIMKLASVYLDKEIRRAKIDARKVGDIHDEWQFVVAKDCVDQFIGLALGVFPRAGESFGYRVPIEGDAKVGLTWAETH